MASCTAVETQKDTLVSMGQVAAARGPIQLKAILGSCIGAALYHPRLRVGVLAHVVLPDSSGRTGLPGKFADTAVPHMLGTLKEMGVNTGGLVAKIVGGANMFGSVGPMQIGDANAEATIRALRTVGIRVARQDVGGSAGRRVTLDCSNGKILVEIVGNPPQIL